MSSTTLDSTVVVTVTYNSSDILGQFLKSVSESEFPKIRVIVVDNASADSDRSSLIAETYGAEFLGLSENLGYGGAANAAVSRLDQGVRFVLIANPDVTLHPHAISRLSEVLDVDSRAAAAGPRILNVDGSIYPSARNQPSLRTGLGHALFSSVWPANPWTRIYRQEIPRATAGPRAVGWLSGACLLVDRAAFEAVGGFDERFFMYFEDVELGRRFLDSGRTNIYAPSAVVTHLGAHSTRGSSARMIIAHHRSAYLFLSQRYPDRLAAPLRLALRVSLALRARVLARRLGR